MYLKILSGVVEFPAAVSIDPDAKDLIRALCTKDVSRRLGNLRGGALDVMRHPWFKYV